MPPTHINFAKTPYERTDSHTDLKFGMWHHSDNPNSDQPSPNPYQFCKNSLWVCHLLRQNHAQSWRKVKKEKFWKIFNFNSKIIIFWWKNLWKINFFIIFFGLAQNYAQLCRKVKEGKFLKNFQFYIVKLSFFNVKTYEKITFSSFF